MILRRAEQRFAGCADWGASALAQSVAVGDLNGDRALDLAVANRDSNNVSVLLGKRVCDDQLLALQQQIRTLAQA